MNYNFLDHETPKLGAQRITVKVLTICAGLESNCSFFSFGDLSSSLQLLFA